MFKDSTLLQTCFVEISVSKGYQSYFWWVVAAVCSHQSNAVEQSLLDPSDRSRQLRMQSLFTSHTITLRRQSIFSLLAFASLWWSPKNGILFKAFFFSALGVFKHPATMHLSGIFPESFQAQNPLTITAKYMTQQVGRFGFPWYDVTARSWTQTLYCVDSRSSSLGVAEAGTSRLDFGGKTRRNPKILFWSSYLWVI